MNLDDYPDDWPAAEESRRYDKGEHRRKHLGRNLVAEIIWDRDYGECVGKCPREFSLARAELLLQRAIPEFRDRSEERPYALWAYYDGAIYTARTSDRGISWHGFPAQDPPKEILERLKGLARMRGEYRKLKKFLEQRCVKT